MPRRLVLGLIFAVGLCGPLQANTITGTASVIDGDTIDALESHQRCKLPRIANSLTTVDEVNKAGTAHDTPDTSTSLTSSLLQMLEPGTVFRIPLFAHSCRHVAGHLEGIPAPLRDRARLFILPNLSATDAIAHFDRLTVRCEWEAERDRCRIFIERMSARPEGISLRQIGKLVDALRDPIAPLYQ